MNGTELVAHPHPHPHPTAIIVSPSNAMSTVQGQRKIVYGLWAHPMRIAKCLMIVARQKEALPTAIFAIPLIAIMMCEEGEQ